HGSSAEILAGYLVLSCGDSGFKLSLETLWSLEGHFASHVLYQPCESCHFLLSSTCKRVCKKYLTVNKTWSLTVIAKPDSQRVSEKGWRVNELIPHPFTFDKLRQILPTHLTGTRYGSDGENAG
ncbi:hypothetical protein, partial [Ruegeria sp.]|uniref:hypothetical protein n=1 Tax=Ruegeria sp. TaxID=1879320 RepID=UPI0023195958